MIKKTIEYYLAQKRHRGKSRVMRLLMSVIPFRSLRSHYGPVLCCNPKDKTNVYAISGDYGHVVSDHVKSLPGDGVFIDVGANYGLFSFMAAAHMKQVYAFEPNPAIYPFFVRSMLFNDAANIVPFHCAIGTEDGFLPLRYDSSHSGKSSLNTQGEDTGKSFTVPVFNIASWTVLDELNSAASIHVKIDVEGYEVGILETLKQASWYKNIKSIVVEIDDENIRKFGSSAKDLYALLQADGFTTTIGLTPDKHYDEIFSR